jgi:hypothetical protein
MPRRRSQSEQRALWLAVAAVVLAVAGLFGFSVLADRGTVDVSNLGDREFTAGAERLARRIDRDGRPFLLADASPQRSRDIYIHHLGDDETEGWYAFAARAPEQDDRACTLDWTGDGFVDPCTGDGFPPDGEGLQQFRTRVEDGLLYVTLREPKEATAR